MCNSAQITAAYRKLSSSIGDGMLMHEGTSGNAKWR